MQSDAISDLKELKTQPIHQLRRSLSTRTAQGIKIRKTQAEKTIRELNRDGLIDYGLEFRRSDDWLIIPLFPSNHELIERLKAKGYEALVAEFQEIHAAKPRSLRDALREKLPNDVLEELPKAFDVIGQIAIIEIPGRLQPYENEIGEAVLKIASRVRLVLNKLGPVDSEFRLRSYRRIGGEGETATQHREHGAVFHLDVSKVYFNPRLSHEHLRIAEQAGAGEVVVDMFAGVGPFPILIARRQSKVRVFAVELNPEAYAYLERNILVNKVHQSVTPVRGDCRLLAESSLKAIADRVIMNFPSNSVSFIDAACKVLGPEGGIVHYYSFQTPEGQADSSESEFRDGVERAGRSVVQILRKRFVREVAPYRYLHVVDARVS